MNAQRLGRFLRAKRLQLGLRQVDVATRADVCQEAVSLVERGVIGRLQVDTIEAVGLAVGVPLDLGPRYDRAEMDRLLDARHAELVEATIRRIAAAGDEWLTFPEYTFNEYGERGSVDILCWHELTATLLIIEIKSEIVDLQDTLAKLDRKLRLLPRVVARERSWHPAHVAVLLVLPDSSAARRAVDRHAATFRAALPDRGGRRIGEWLRKPETDLRGVLFLSPTTRGGANRAAGKA